MREHARLVVVVVSVVVVVAVVKLVVACAAQLHWRVIDTGSGA